ncbi:BlaI/MecI/CopY family transcriptional regulator [bacterium]|nr:BlaI/MecI/CopY family transcriptional regulator [bacterium]
MINNKLTPVEWEIMDIIWNLNGSPSVRDVVDHAYSNGEKAYTTVQTIMNTLEKKNILKRNKIGLVNFYTPVRTRTQMIKSEMSSVVSRIFKGSVPALANFIMDTQNLSLEEIRQIKDLLSRKENELRRRS